MLVRSCSPHFEKIRVFFQRNTVSSEKNADSAQQDKAEGAQKPVERSLPNEDEGKNLKSNIQELVELFVGVMRYFRPSRVNISDDKKEISGFSKTVDIFVWIGSIIIACITIASFGEVLINHHFGDEPIFHINPIKSSGSPVSDQRVRSTRSTKPAGPYVERAPIVYSDETKEANSDLKCPCSTQPQHCMESARRACHSHSTGKSHRKSISQNNINISVQQESGKHIESVTTSNSALSTAELHVQFIQKWAEYDKIISQKVVGDILLLVIIIEILSLVKSLVDEGQTSVPITLAIAVTSITRSLVQPQDNVASLGQPVISGMGEVLQGSAGVFLLVIAAVLAQRYLRPSSSRSDRD